MRTISVAVLKQVAVAAMICGSGLTSDAQPALRYMELGENRLPPLALTAYCVRKPLRCLPADEIRKIPLTNANRSELERIQGEVNSKITPLVLLPKEADIPWDDDVTLGACHDYALTKRSRLLELGYPSSALLLAMAYVQDGAHLVLIVVTDEGDYVMDNLLGNLARWDRLPYRWVMRSMPRNLQYWQAIVPRSSVEARADQPRLYHACDLSDRF